MREQIITIGAIVPGLVGILPFADQIILESFKVAFRDKGIQDASGTYWRIVEIFWKEDELGKIMARVQEEKH